MAKERVYLMLAGSMYRIAFIISLFLPLAVLAGAQEDLSASVERALTLLYEEQVEAPIEEREAAVHGVLQESISFPVISQRALGRGWRDLNPDEQARFRELFTRLLIRSYTRRFLGLKRPSVEWQAESDIGRGRIELPSLVTLDGTGYSVVYRMGEIDGKMQVYDIIIENVGLVSNYRKQFSSILARKGVEAVFEALEEKLATVEEPEPLLK